MFDLGPTRRFAGQTPVPICELRDFVRLRPHGTPFCVCELPH